jgi:hypothetical protein
MNIRRQDVKVENSQEFYRLQPLPSASDFVCLLSSGPSLHIRVTSYGSFLDVPKNISMGFDVLLGSFSMHCDGS